MPVGEVQVTYFRRHFLIRFNCGSLRSWSLATKLAFQIFLLFFSSMMMIIAFITIKSSLVLLIEGLCAQIYLFLAQPRVGPCWRPWREAWHP